MTGTGKPTATGASMQRTEKPGEELVPGEELGLGKEHKAREQGPREETAEQRRQRRLLRELALRALI